MKNKVFKNRISITAVFVGGKQYAFGIIMEPAMRPAFIPHTLVNSFELTPADVGSEFFCMFVEQEDRPNPLVIGLSEEEYDFKPSEALVNE